MVELSLASRVTIPEAVVSRDLGGETVVLNLETGVYFGLDPVGTDIWTALGTGATLQETADQLQAKYDATAEVVAADVLRFVGQMAAKGLVQTAPAA